MIVGGTGGIGLATARRFLDEGGRVVVSGLSSGEAAEAARILGPIGPSWAEAADASDEVAVDGLFERAIGYLGGRLDVLVHVAGISGRRFGDGPLDACAAEGWDLVMSVNARGVFLTNRASVRQMLAQELDGNGQRGTVVNIGSVLTHSPAPHHFGTVGYAASKGAIEALTRAAAARYAANGIRFNLLAPGLIDSPMSRRAADDPAIRHYLASKQPIAGGPGLANDVAEAALFLAEPASRFVDGVVLNVDGGWSVSEGQYGAD